MTWQDYSRRTEEEMIMAVARIGDTVVRTLASDDLTSLMQMTDRRDFSARAVRERLAALGAAPVCGWPSYAESGFRIFRLDPDPELWHLWIPVWSAGAPTEAIVSLVVRVDETATLRYARLLDIARDLPLPEGTEIPRSALLDLDEFYQAADKIRAAHGAEWRRELLAAPAPKLPSAVDKAVRRAVRALVEGEYDTLTSDESAEWSFDPAAIQEALHAWGSDWVIPPQGISPETQVEMYDDEVEVETTLWRSTGPTDITARLLLLPDGETGEYRVILKDILIP